LWELSKYLNSDDEDAEEYNPKARRKRSGPTINVKKRSNW